MRGATQEQKQEVCDYASQGFSDSEIAMLTGLSLNQCVKITTRYWRDKMERKQLYELNETDRLIYKLLKMFKEHVEGYKLTKPEIKQVITDCENYLK